MHLAIRSSRAPLAGAAALVLGLAACGGGGGGGDPDAAPAAPDAAPDAAPVGVARGVDVLFVIDDSGSMLEEQERLADAFLDDFIGALEAAHGARPDLHIGVVSTDMGAGPYGIGGCTSEHGALQTAPRIDGCSPPSDPYLVDRADGSGGRETNYEGTLGEAFACIARLGATGCGFEQPLAALRASLTYPYNAGFLRDGAALAIVLLGDEDDCSADDPGVFDPAGAGLDSPLGPLSSFRCFEFGVVCDPDAPRVDGEKQGCRPRTGSYLVDPVAIADAVKDVKPAAHVAVAVITGDLAPVRVGRDTIDLQRPMLMPSCEAADGGTAVPGIRLAAFAAEFGDRGETSSICGAFTSPLQALAARVAAMLE